MTGTLYLLSLIHISGIPLVVPGEIMNDKLIDDVIKAVNSGLEVEMCIRDRPPGLPYT